MNVYRYMPYKYFKEMVENKSLRFVNPLTEWKDADDKEGFLFLISNVKPDEIRSEIPQNLLVDALFQQIKCGGIYEEDGNSDDWFAMRCQCWSKNKNSESMWREYSEDFTSVCVEVPLPKLTNLHFREQKVEAIEVQYRQELDIKEELNNILGRHNELWYPRMFESKRIKYSFENEYRLYVSMLDKDGHKICADNVINIPLVEPINEYVSEVLPDPSMTKDLREKVRDFCQNHDLGYIDNYEAVKYSENDC